MAKFKTELASVSWANKKFKAVKGVITIPDDELGPFMPLIECGQLVSTDEAVDETDDKDKKVEPPK